MLAGLAETDSFDARECDSFIGTSAGSIVTAMLCAGIDPRSRLGELPEPPAAPEVDGAGPTEARRMQAAVALAARVATPLAAIALRTSEPGGRLLRRAALSRAPLGTRSLADLGKAVEDSDVRWDGRLQISAVELESGRRVMLDGSGSPKMSVAEAVQASCAIPGVFSPIVVDGRSYVDGGVWSPTNMDRAEVGRGSVVLSLNPTGSLRPRGATPWAAVLAVSRAAAAVEAAALRQRGAKVLVVSPDRASVKAFGRNLMDPKPESRTKVIAAGLAQGQALASS
jgi:NTE family protein